MRCGDRRSVIVLSPGSCASTRLAGISRSSKHVSARNRACMTGERRARTTAAQQRPPGPDEKLKNAGSVMVVSSTVVRYGRIQKDLVVRDVVGVDAVEAGAVRVDLRS